MSTIEREGMDRRLKHGDERKEVGGKRRKRKKGEGEERERDILVNAQLILGKLNHRN